MKNVKRIKTTYIIVSALMILLGLLFVILPDITLNTVCYIIGALLIVFGITKLICYFAKDIYRLAFQFDLALGIAAIVLGALIMLKSVKLLIPISIGIFMLFDGAFKLQTTIDAKRFGIKYWWLILTLAILTCACGFLLIFNPFDGIRIIAIMLGISLVVDGIQNLCVAAYTVKTNIIQCDDFEVEEDND